MSEIVNVDEEAIEKLRDALQTAGEDYKANLDRLESLIIEITFGVGFSTNTKLSSFDDILVSLITFILLLLILSRLVT